MDGEVKRLHVTQNSFLLKGDICYSKNREEIVTKENHYLVCEDGKSKGIFPEIPQKYMSLPLHNYEGCLIIPGLVDLHVHAPQFSFRGMGMDMELLDWLNTCAFPEEAKYGEHSYAEKAYGMFAEEMKHSATARACVFASIHVDGTKILMELLEKTGVIAYVGKVNMDRNAPEYLCEAGAGKSIEDTRRWLEQTKNRFGNIKPILTPRFIPSCTDELMQGLHEIQEEQQLPVQSHLSENLSEVSWVKELCPWAGSYAEAYNRHKMFGGEGCPTVMAHCVYNEKEEIQLMKQQGVFIAHCPQSNMNLSSGIAPVRKYLEAGIRVGLGSDIAGGSSISIFRAMTDAIQVSKLRWRLCDDSLAPLKMEEAFYMGTKGGGAFFGEVGSFEQGYEFDAIILDDRTVPYPQSLTLKERLERMIYLSDGRQMIGKYVAGRCMKGI
ncbi:MAG TPA: amidohydrolase family protein [Clostridiales bacterium]|nr:amidohydrolase family protein [Clostridiales bacterium]